MKLKQSIVAAAMALTMSVSTQTMANDEVAKAAKTVSNAWTECGIGAMIFKEIPVGAAISNVIWDLGTTAVISMVASPETCQGVRVAAAVFMNESIDAIEADTAKGNGAHLTAMLSLMGVEESNHATVAEKIRASIAEKPEVLALPATEKAQAFYALTEQAIKVS